MQFTTLLLSVTLCLSKTLLLVPKPYILSVFDINEFNAEHDIYEFVKIDDFVVYKTEKTNYLNTLEQMFYVESEQMYSVSFLDNLYYAFLENADVIFDETVVPWHLGRVIKRDLPLNNTFNYLKCNTNGDIIVNNIVIDTGIDIHHDEFEGRVTWLGNFADNDDKDGNSHGTHCAGLIGSKTFGVCKDANLFAIKVLGSDGSGTTSGVISGIEAAYKHHIKTQANNKSKIVKTVVSMSLGGGKSISLNRAVQATLKDPNFYFAAAAGNENNDACGTSPASVKEIFTVMASDRNDKRAYFSNYGTCADIYSPGVDIESTIPNGKTAVYSGTSQSTPILVGILTHYINMYPELAMKEMKSKILSDATQDHIYRAKSNNLLIYLQRN
jgi:Subtilisin-like serine proteases